MATKITISLPDERLVAEALTAVARGESASVSAFIAETVEKQGRHQNLSELLAEMTAQAGPPNAEDRAWARVALGLA